MDLLWLLNKRPDLPQPSESELKKKTVDRRNSKQIADSLLKRLERV